MSSPIGNTPTGVGKTGQPAASPVVLGKHPHGRGEDRGGEGRGDTPRETPPRAWGRPEQRHGDGHAAGNTPTGVGKTPSLYGSGQRQGKHPHGRGEDPCSNGYSSVGLETPPRAWGRPALSSLEGKPVRNTPTGVGKT